MPTLTILDSPDHFLPNPGGQRGFMDDYTHRYCALAGGWFAGKTWAGARKLVDLHLHNALDAKEQPTGVRSAVIAPTYQLANDFDMPELRRTFEEMNLSYKFIADPKRYCFALPDLSTRKRPSEILIRTADAPERITGWTVGAIWGDEAARWKCDAANPLSDPFVQADARLRDTKARFLQFMVTFTHEGDDTRVYRDFEREPKPDHVLYRAGTFENPHAQAFGAVQKQQLSGELAGQYLDGIAMSTGGQRMYASFDEARNVDSSLKISRDSPLQISVDFNIDPGMHCILGQHFPKDDLLTATHEIHEPRMNVKAMVAALRRLIEKEFGGWMWNSPLQIFGDASGSGKWAGVGESCYDVLIECLRVAGVPYQLRVPRSNPHVADRVNAVNCALNDAAGNVRYRIHPRCTRLIDDYRSMRWLADGSADKRDHRRSHASDADGYRVHYLMPIRRMQMIGGRIGVYGG
jgi:hypothetical protein